MTKTDTSSHDTTLPRCNSLTLVIGHVQFNRSLYVDEILERLELREHHFVAAAAHSVFYSSPIGILGEWNNDYFEELWDFALPSSFYEHGSSFEKMVLVNEQSIKEYALWLLLQYQNYLFSALHLYSAYYNEVAKQGGYVFLGTNYSLITFGNEKHEYFDRYCTFTVEALPIRPSSGVNVTSINDCTTLPYYLTRKGD